MKTKPDRKPWAILVAGMAAGTFFSDAANGTDMVLRIVSIAVGIMFVGFAVCVIKYGEGN